MAQTKELITLNSYQSSTYVGGTLQLKPVCKNQQTFLLFRLGSDVKVRLQASEYDYW